jgi:hypothetical protein
MSDDDFDPEDPEADSTSREAIEYAIETADWDEEGNADFLLLHRTILNLRDLTATQWAMDSHSFSFVTQMYEWMLIMLKLITDIQGELLMVADRIPDMAPDILVQVDEAVQDMLEKMTLEGPNDYVRWHRAYMKQMVLDLTGRSQG